MIDIHSHILFGVDDGCKTIDGSINLIKESINAGITDLFLTPHFSYRRKFTTSYEEIEKKFNLLKKYVLENNLEVNLYLGSEIDEHSGILEYLDSYLCHTMNNTKYVLLDFGTRKADIDDFCYELIVRGYKPIIAHPERYVYINDIDIVKKWKKTGALIQINAASLFHGGHVKKQALQFLKNNLVDFISSDTHSSIKTIGFLSKAFDYVTKKYGEETATKLFVTEGRKILDKTVIN